MSVCRSYILPNTNKFIDKSGVYYEVLKNWRGCDSIITYILNVKIVDDFVIHNGSLLTARNTNAQYQWLNCSQGYKIIDGATSRNYIAPANLIYAVELTEGGCKDTSDCVQVTNAAISKIHESGIQIHPNPSHGVIQIQISEELTHANASLQMGSITIYNAAGAIVYKKLSQPIQNTTINLGEYPGIYFVQIETAAGLLSKTIIVN
jgi:ADP-ribosylglycohydrolase